MTPACGNIVLYKLDHNDTLAIEKRRLLSGVDGNPIQPGDVVPLIVVRVFPDEFGPGVPGVNGKLVLDGNDSYWATSVAEGENPGQWKAMQP